MATKGKRGKKKQLIWGVFPMLFWLNVLLAALYTVVSGNIFLGIAVFWPAGFFICLMYTVHEIKFLPVAERREYLIAMAGKMRKTKNNNTRSKAIKR